MIAGCIWGAPVKGFSSLCFPISENMLCTYYTHVLKQSCRIFYFSRLWRLLLVWKKMLEDNMYQLSHSSTSCHQDISIGCLKAMIKLIKTGNNNFQNEKGKEHKSWNVYALWRKYISCTFVMQTSYFNIVYNLKKSNMRLFRSVGARDENSEKYFIIKPIT